ncbi:MAG: efflux RND transporter periplasmic adaptor subunit [Verrucomicrobiota bacterium]
MNRLALTTMTGLALLLVSGCKKATAPEALPPRPVKTALVGSSATSIERSFSGQVQNAEGAPLAFESGGRVTQVIAREGVRYQEGDILAEVDETTYRSALLGAEAAMVNARQELRRTQQLFETNNASQASLEAAVAAEASARSSFEQAEKALNDVVLKMPYDGVIGRIDLEAQQVVNAGQEIMTIQGESGKEFEIGVTPDDISKLEVDMPGRLRLGALPQSEIAVSVSEISPEVNENATYTVTFLLDPESKDDPSIRAGMDGEVDIDLPNPEGEVLKVPIEAIASSSEGKPYVWTLAPIQASPGTAKVTKQFITTKAMASGGMIEVTDGLKGGERIVIRGVNSLDEEMVVTLLD